MRCINKNKKVFKQRRKSKRHFPWRIAAICVLFVLILGVVFVFSKNPKTIADYEYSQYKESVYQEELPVEKLCVASDDVNNDEFRSDSELHAIGLFDIQNSKVILADDIHERLYPASTTKLLTAYLALKYGNLEDVVTVSKEAVGVPLDSSRAGLFTGDKVTVEQLLYGLMLPSGNDSAVAIAEYISGSEEAFATLMNEEALLLGATNSHFVNAHGYHDDEHYTTAYDLYLILNACVRQEKFLEIISADSYNTRITQKNGTYREVSWKQSNRYINGSESAPDGVTVVGGKTGTTDEAGACLVLYANDSESNPYISIVMGADNRTELYNNMSGVLALIE